ncbi:hypothetical protein [Pseudonocardia xishanensis]|uniref:hypothetical protein n=1 Tax=Pseudonocardia xishanensis TaxID=630995 RepID=UPI0031F09E93
MKFTPPKKPLAMSFSWSPRPPSDGNHGISFDSLVVSTLTTFRVRSSLPLRGSQSSCSCLCQTSTAPSFAGSASLYESAGTGISTVTGLAGWAEVVTSKVAADAKP